MLHTHYVHCTVWTQIIFCTSLHDNPGYTPAKYNFFLLCWPIIPACSFTFLLSSSSSSFHLLDWTMDVCSCIPTTQDTIAIVSFSIFIMVFVYILMELNSLRNALNAPLYRAHRNEEDCPYTIEESQEEMQFF